MNRYPPSALQPRANDGTSARQWIAVGALAVATFIVVTSEMLPVGVLTPMAGDLDLDAGTAGMINLTVTGLVCAITAPVVPRLLGDLDRRAVLAAAMFALAIANALTATATGSELLLLSRVILGMGMGTVWGLAAAVAARLVATRNIALAISLTVSGVAAASVLGVPLGTMIGNAFGWRAAFGSLSAIAGIAAIGIALTLPTLRRPTQVETSGDTIAQRSLLNPAVMTGLAFVAFLVTAHFAAYTYIRPVLESHTGLSANAIALLLLLYGLFGLVGNFAAGAAAAREPRRTVLTLAAGISLAIAALAGFGTIALATGAAIALWGVAYGGVSVGGQLLMNAAAPDRVEHITGLYVGVFTASIALGAAVGGILMQDAGIVPMLWATAALAVCSLIVGMFVSLPSRPVTVSAAGR